MPPGILGKGSTQEVSLTDGRVREADETARRSAASDAPSGEAAAPQRRGKTVHGEAANAGHRVLAPDDAEVEAYLETALNAAGPDRSPDDRPAATDPDD